MENKIDEKELITSNDNKQIRGDKILVCNIIENNIVDNDLKKEKDENSQIKEENKNANNLDKSQALQDKLKKIFMERETNKYKYNIVKIPDNLKYTSDNSNSSSPRKSIDKPNVSKNIDVNSNNKINNVNEKEVQNNKMEINKEIIDKNKSKNINNEEKNKNNENEKKVEKDYKEDIYNITDKINNIKNFDNYILKNNEKNKIMNSNVISNKDIKHSILKPEINNIQNNNENTYNKNEINIEQNNIKENNNIIDKIFGNNNIENNKNNKNDENNIFEHNQTCKNYVIKRMPERKKNKNTNKNEEDERNKTFSMGFINNKKRISSNHKNSEHNTSVLLNGNKNKGLPDISSTMNIKKNKEKEENEEERNKRLYRLLMAKKLCGNNDIIKNNINEAINSNKLEIQKDIQNETNFEISEKNIKTQPLNNFKIETSESCEEKKSNMKEEENQDSNLLSPNKINNDKGKNTNIKASKEVNAKEGALKILELIKAKKNEKNIIDQKKKETQEIIKKSKAQTINITESNSTLVTKEEENNENKNNYILSPNKENQVKENQNKYEKDTNFDKKEEKNEKMVENKTKEIPRKIYTRAKGKSYLMGNNNLKIKNEFDNVINNNLMRNKNANSNKKEEKENINIIKNEPKKELKADEKVKKNLQLYIKDITSYKNNKEENNINYKSYKTNYNNNNEKNLEEKNSKAQLEIDLTNEIKNKDESTIRENKEKNNFSNKNKFIGINRRHTTDDINNKLYYIPNKKRQRIEVNRQANENNNINKSNIDNPHNFKDLHLTKNENNVKTNNKSPKITSKNINNNFYSIKNKKYEVKTFENQNRTIDNYNKMTYKNNITLKNKNKSNNIYAPKKCHMLSKEKIRKKDLTPSPNSREIPYSINLRNKIYKSPKVFRLNNEKMTYFKKNLSNAFGNNIFYNNNRLNNSLGNIPSAFNNNFDINKIIKNKISTEIESLELKPNLNSSFQMRLNLERNKYYKGNIFNQDDDDEFNNDNICSNLNLNSSFNNRFFQKNIPNNPETNKFEQGFNTFYENEKNKNEYNYINQNLYISNNYNFKNNFDNVANYGRTIDNKNNIINMNDSRNNLNTICDYKNENKNSWNRRYDNNKYNSINIFKQNNNNNNHINLYDSFKYEDLLILEDKLLNIMISLNSEKLISNECFEYWNYFFNCSLYENINKLLSNIDLENKKLIKVYFNYNLMSIILSYDSSFEPEKLNKIRPLLLEMLELCHKLLLISYELVLNLTTNNNNKNNLWIKKLYNLINNSRLQDNDSETLFLESPIITEKEIMKFNINYLMKKIYYILNNYPSSITQDYLMNLYKKISNRAYEEINNFFLEYIFREKDLKYSILASTLLKSGERINTQPCPYLNFPSQKNYTLILDVDETLFHFKIYEEDDEQGVLKIRPGVFQFIDEIKEYYEIVLFSEAEKSYIDLIADAIGDNRYLYDYILCREYVTVVGKNFVKELSKIGRPLDRIIIIDNMPQNFSFNKENGIYIKSFFGEENDDKALIDLIPILVNIARSGNDVRKELLKYKEKIVTKISSNIYKHNNL